MKKPDDFSRQVFADIMKDRDPAYITTIDLVEYGYQLALRDYREHPKLFGKQPGRQVRVLDSSVEETIVWHESEDG